MVKIFVDKNDSVAQVVEKVIKSKEDEILLIIPQDPVLKESAVNFLLIGHEAKNAGKKVSVESVDEEIVEFAKKSGIDAGHPLFKEKIGRSSFSDIVAEKTPNKSGAHKKARNHKPVAEPIVERAETSVENLSRAGEKETASIHKKSGRRFRFTFLLPRGRTFWIFLGIVLIAAAGMLFVNRFFASAQVLISFKKIPWQYRGDFLASKTFSAVDRQKNYLPAEILTQKRNVTQAFPASGKAYVYQKAKGVMTIYNSYSSAPQIFVAATRFQTLDGKIFRIDRQVTVPGAKISDGKIAPSGIDVPATANKAGSDYNIGPADRLSIPGLKGTPKYDGFYGSLKNGASGGFIGSEPVPTDQDVTSAKEKISALVKNILQNELLNNRPADLLILDGASQAVVSRVSVNTSTDSNGNFAVFGEGQFQAVAFREADVRLILQSLANGGYPDMSFRDLKFSYGKAAPDFGAGQLRFHLSADAVLAPAFNAVEWRKKIGGLRIDQARSLILSLPDLDQAKISIWPSWLNSLPSDTGRINIIAD